MEYRRPDNSDDDPTPSHPGRPLRGGHFGGNERNMSGTGHHRRSSAADQHVRKLEHDAYLGVLRAFRAQSASITWRKEQVMVTLRQELGITDQEHLEYVNVMNSDTALRERDEHIGPMYAPHMESYEESLLPGSRKRQKSRHILQTSPVELAMRSALSPPSSVPSSIGKKALSAGGLRRQKSRGGHQHQTGSSLGAKVSSMGGLTSSEAMADPWLTGKRISPRWSEDNALNNEVVVTHYEYETEEVPSIDPQFLDMRAVSLSNKEPPRASEIPAIGSRGAAGRDSIRGGEKSVDLSSVGGRGHSASKGHPALLQRPVQGLPLKSRGLKHIHVPSLETLIKQVDKIAGEDDLAKVESIRRSAKEHEELLRKALAEIGDTSEEDEEENRTHLPAHSPDHERGTSGQQSRDEHEDVGEDDAAGTVTAGAHLADVHCDDNDGDAR